MKKFISKSIVICLMLIAVLSSSAQTVAILGKTEVPEKSDTITVRFNNKLYYTITENNHWRVADNKVIFTPVNGNDTLPDIKLDYISSKPSLLKRLAKGDTIKNCLIGEMKLSFSDFMDQSQNKYAVHNICSRKLVFSNCIFNRVLADTTVNLIDDDSKEQKKLKFLQDVSFLNCTFSKGLEISDCIFEKKFFISGQITCSSPSSIDNCEFHDYCYLLSLPDYSKKNSFLKMSSCVFYDPFIFSIMDNDKTHISIDRCKFKDVFSLGKSAPQLVFRKFHSASANTNRTNRMYNYYSNYGAFLKNKFSKEYYISNDSIETFMPNRHTVYNFSMVHCQAKIIDIANTSMMDCSFEDVSILQCIDVTGSTFNYSSNFTGKQALEDLDFPNTNCVIYASYKTFSPEAFKLNIYLEKIRIHPLVHNYFDSTSDFIQDNSNFYNMITDYSAKKFTNEDLVTTLKSRFNHEKSDWERSYHGEHILHGNGIGDRIGSFFQWSLSWFLEITVSNGYKGEWKFSLWVVFLILLFSFIYYFRHKEAVIDYLNSKFNKEDDAIKNYETLTVHRTFNGFRDYTRCLWFSCMVFVDPRLPISFFNLRVGLFGSVLAEWLCGLTAIVLFLVFLASNYPFIHTLIGI